MNFLSRTFEALFKIQLKRAFKQATNALSANDLPVLKAVLINTEFEKPQKQSLLFNAITTDNLDGFKTILQGTGTKVSETLSVSKKIPFVYEILYTPMLPFAISSGSEKIARFLADHPNTDLKASTRSVTIATGAHVATCFYTDDVVVLDDVQAAAQSAGMKDVAEIISARLNAQTPQAPSNV